MKFVQLVLFLLVSGNLFPQGLLLNGDFEDENICTEYKVNCAPEAWISSSDGFSNYFKDAGRAWKGEHCMAIQAGHSRKSYQRTYIRSQLTCRLHKGNQYHLELFVKSSHFILDSIGVYFTAPDPLLENKPLQYITPSILLKDGIKEFAKDTSWQKISLLYTATGNETFVLIGNFSKRDINGSTGIAKENQFLIFIDDISMWPENDNERICQDWEQVKERLYETNERHEFLRRSLKSQKNRFSPLPLKATTILAVDTLLLPDVLFASGKKDLQPPSYLLLDSFCRNMQGKTVDSIVIEGHTDNVGSDMLNAQLSAGRANTVATYLKQCDYLQQTTIITRGRASQYPLADNKTPAGRRQNRRVELLFYIRE